MSWGIKLAGKTTAALKAEVDKATGQNMGMPAAYGDMLKAVIDGQAPLLESSCAYLLETSGHIGPDYVSDCVFSIKRITVAE